MSFIDAPWKPALAKTWSATSRICSRRAVAESRWDMCYPMVTGLPAVLDVVALGGLHGVADDDRRGEQCAADDQRHDDQRCHRGVEVEHERHEEQRHGERDEQITDTVGEQRPLRDLG